MTYGWTKRAWAEVRARGVGGAGEGPRRGWVVGDRRSVVRAGGWVVRARAGAEWTQPA